MKYIGILGGGFLGYQAGALAMVAIMAVDLSDGEPSAATGFSLLGPIAGAVLGAYIGYRVAK